MNIPKNKRIKSRKVFKQYALDHPFCELCGGLPDLAPHHIIYKSHENGHDIPQNLITLCRNHHSLAHGKDSKTWKAELQDFKNG